MNLNELFDHKLLELKMSPSWLQAQASKIDAKVGIEFEMFVPGYEFKEDEPDMSYNGIVDWDQSTNMILHDLIQFFGNEDKRILQDWLQEQRENYRDWLQTSFNRISTGQYNIDYQDWLTDFAELEFDDIESMDEIALKEKFDEFYFEQYKAAHNFDYYMSTIKKITHLSDISVLVLDDYWPHMKAALGSEKTKELADSFTHAVGYEVNLSSEYHSTDRDANKFCLEPDPSLNSMPGGMEFISPPLSLSEMTEVLPKIFDWAESVDAVTTKECGLHINVSVPGYSKVKLDPIKLILFVGDEYLLRQFDRLNNAYAPSAEAQLKKAFQKNNAVGIERTIQVMDLLKKSLAKNIMPTIEAYMRREDFARMSVNIKDTYVEFRSPGGNWLSMDLRYLLNVINRLVVALNIACDETAERQEYAKKLYDVISKSTEMFDNPTASLFARFNTGQLSKQELKRELDKMYSKRTGVEINEI